MIGPTCRGLTLAEVLVVLAILSVLTGMTVPAVLTVRRMVDRATCRDHLRQVGVVLLAYVEGNDGTFPTASQAGIDDPARSPAWFHRLPAQLDQADVRNRSIFQCPAYHAGKPRYFSNASPKSYKMNDYLAKTGAYVQGTWPDEGSIVLFFDAVAGETGMGQWGHGRASAVEPRRHHGYVNLLMLDGRTVTCAAGDTNTPWRKTLRWTGEP